MDNDNNEVYTTNISNCLNCETELKSSDSFCPNCGQKTTASILSIKEILSNFLSNTLYLDSKMWSSFGKLFIPSKTTSEYVKGKRKSYIHPFRLFFVSAIIFFGLMNLVFSKIIETVSDDFDVYQNISTKLDLYDRRAKLIDSLNIVDTLVLSKINYVADLEPQNENGEPLNDTIVPLGTMVNISGENEVATIKHSMNNRDIVNLPPIELLDKYEVKGWWNRYNFKQSLRMTQSPIEIIKYIMNNFIWGVFFLIAFCALILRLLFYRRKKTYIEALLLLFEVHSIGFILSVIGVLIEYFIGRVNFNVSIGIAVLLSGIYFAVMLKRYYKEHILWVIFKTFLFAIIYFIMFLIFMTLTSIIAVGFF